MIVYHRTTQEAASSILADGFRDGEGTYLTSEIHRGVWVSDSPLDANEGASGCVLFTLETPSDSGSSHLYEWVQEPSFGYRESLVPADELNKAVRWYGYTLEVEAEPGSIEGAKELKAWADRWEGP